MNRYEFILKNCDVKKLHEIGVTKSNLITEMRVMKTYLSKTGKKMDKYFDTAMDCNISHHTVREMVAFMSKEVTG